MSTSRLPAFYKLPHNERISLLADRADLSDSSVKALSSEGGLSPELADKMIENVVGGFCLPLGIATNFHINDRDYLIPMAIEEPSVVAGASNAAKLFREGGFLTSTSLGSIMIGQIQVLDVPDLIEAQRSVLDEKSILMQQAEQVDPLLVRVGGGVRDLQLRQIDDSPVGPMLLVELYIDCRDAMGANAVNTACEAIAPRINQLTGGRVNLRILSNLADQRLVRVKGHVPHQALTKPEWDGEIVARRIVEAAALADVDPYRAATHNKGIMNGVDSVAIATGNDWRALEAGAHAFAARSGDYTALSRWWQDDEGDLWGEMEIPMAVGTVGGATRVHPTAQAALQILGTTSAAELGEVMAAVGLVQNLAALRALATSGIQHGHMRLHARQIAIAAGANEAQVDQIAQQMISEATIRLDRAREILSDGK